VLFFYYTSFKEFLFQPITTQVTVFSPPKVNSHSLTVTRHVLIS